MLYMWTMRTKEWKTKLANLRVTWCEAHWGACGLAFEWNYSKKPAFHRYDRSAWLRIQFLWAEVFFGADWGRKPEHEAAMRRAHETLFAQAKAAKLWQ